MKTITVYNKGKRKFNHIKSADGNVVHLEPLGFLEMEEVAGLRLIASYPKELTSSKTAGPSTADLNRREQSIRDREKVLDEREAKLIEREKALEPSDSDNKPRRGRPPKIQEPTDSDETEE